MNGLAQVAFRVRQHVPGEAGDLLCSKPGFDGEQQVDLVPLRVAGLLKESLEVRRLAAVEGLGLLGEAHGTLVVK